jgi:hypothetical protein
MENDWRNVIANTLPMFVGLLIFLLFVFRIISQKEKKNAKSLENLKEQEPEKWKKIVKYNAYIKLAGWSFLGILALGGGVYRFFKFPDEEKLQVLFVVLIAILFIFAGVSSYFDEIKKIR